MMRREILSEKLTIGRDASCDIELTDDDISRIHFMISFENGFAQLIDKSTNGTFVNGKKVQNCELNDNDAISISKWKIVFDAGKTLPSQRETIIKSLKSTKAAGTGDIAMLSTSLGPIIGVSKAMQEIFALLAKISPSNAAVFITGESGTGKELTAKWLHENSPRSEKPFIAMNCGAIPASLIESELFGHERGAFTNATNQHRGVFEQAHGGTLFLDEIGEMPLDLQTRLLRVLENKVIRRVGGKAEVQVDVRIIVATNKEPKKIVEEGKFREDLFFRLYVMPITLPALRFRKDDVIPIAEYFLQEMTPDGNTLSLNKEAQKKLFNYVWPGNVRELKNTLQRAVLTAGKTEITAENISFAEVSAYKIEDDMTLEGNEKKAILKALEQAKGNVSTAAKMLKVARTTLFSMAQKYNIPLEKIREK